jgi:putative ABC transport system permease protein
MLKHYLLHFVRGIQRQKLFTSINLLGLTAGITSALLIYLYAQHEFSYDHFHTNADHIYRVNQTFIWGENNDHEFASTGPGVAYAVKEELPEVTLMSSIHTPGDQLISFTNNKKEVVTFDQTNILAADSNFFRLFNFPLVKGDAASALRQANTLVMTEKTAQKYFGTEDPIGKMVSMGSSENQQTFEVTGVVKELPTNTYLQFEMLVSMTSYPMVKKLYWSWVWTQLETYVLLDPSASVAQVREKLKIIPAKHAEATLQRVMNMSYEDYVKSGKKWELFLQPVTGIHLPSKVVYNRLPNDGNVVIMYSLVGAAFFIILLSCVNFMNLSTAQFTKRMKEVSIRKILGLGRLPLSMGYFLEAFVFCIAAVAISLALLQLVLPAFNLLVGRELQFTLLGNPKLLLTLGVLLLSMSLISGSYPALFLSAFNPIQALKGKLNTGSEGKTFRNSLVVFQFTISIALISCTAVVFQQLSFVAKKDLGFDRENLLVLSHGERIKDAQDMVAATENIQGIVSASMSTSVPPNLWGGDKFTAEGMSDRTFPLNFTSADENYIPTLKVRLSIGRNFSKEKPGDESRVILNETAVAQIGWKLDESVIGKKIQLPGSDIFFEVIGVVKDYNYWTLGNPIEPMAIFHLKNDQLFGGGAKQYLVARIDGKTADGWKNTVAQLEALYKQKAGDFPFEYTFVDQAFANTFKGESNFAKTLTIMACLCILIASLGLLGMIVYALEQRTKEIGIRKVSGASVIDILLIISKGYTRLIMLAFIIGAPLSYWLMTQWLQSFEYHISPSPYIYLGAGVGTLLTALAITSYHSMKAALLNPVDVLKDE